MEEVKSFFDTSNFWTLNWYYIVAILVSITALIVGYKNYKKKPSPSSGLSNHLSSSSSGNNTTIAITNNVNGAIERDVQSADESISKSDEKLKATTKILFVDDNHADYKMVSILKRAGWSKTKSVKDITDLDAHAVLDSDIIFVDINGVGLTLFEDQGLGLASALKSKYPKKKIVIYSSETSGDRFHKALREVDGCLYKDAEPYQFISVIENFIKERK